MSMRIQIFKVWKMNVYQELWMLMYIDTYVSAGV